MTEAEREKEFTKQALWYKSGYTQGYAMGLYQAELEASAIAKDSTGNKAWGAELAKEVIQKEMIEAKVNGYHAIDWLGTIIECANEVEEYLIANADDVFFTEKTKRKI